MRSVGAVSLDIDNTLWDRDHSADLVFKNWVLNADNPNEVTMKDLRARDQSGHSSRDEFFHWIESELGISNAWECFQKELLRTIKPNQELGVALKRLKDNQIPVIVLSDGGSTFQREKLSCIGVIDQLDVIFISEETGFKKPSRKAFLKVIDYCSQLNIDTEDIIHCGDYWEKDIIGAQHCGMQTYHVLDTPKLPSFLNSLSLLTK